MLSLSFLFASCSRLCFTRIVFLPLIRWNAFIERALAPSSAPCHSPLSSLRLLCFTYTSSGLILFCPLPSSFHISGLDRHAVKQLLSRCSWRVNAVTQPLMLSPSSSEALLPVLSLSSLSSTFFQRGTYYVYPTLLL